MKTKSSVGTGGELNVLKAFMNKFLKINQAALEFLWKTDCLTSPHNTSMPQHF